MSPRVVEVEPGRHPPVACSSRRKQRVIFLHDESAEQLTTRIRPVSAVEIQQPAIPTDNMTQPLFLPTHQRLSIDEAESIRTRELAQLRVDFQVNGRLLREQPRIQCLQLLVAQVAQSGI